MSFGSRATQAKPEAQTSCSERPITSASFLRETASSCPYAHPGHQKHVARGLGPGTVARYRCYGKTRVRIARGVLIKVAAPCWSRRL